MLAPLAAKRPCLTPRKVTGWETFFEVQTMHGVVDILFVVPSARALARRVAAELPAVTDPAQVASLLALTEVGAVTDSRHTGSRVEEFASWVPVSRGHLQRHVLPALTETGWVVAGGDGTWPIRRRYEIPLERIVAVEVKRGEWRRALSQATPHTDFADATFVALDAARTPSLARVTSAFAHAGVGLVTVADIPGDDATVLSHVAVRLRPGRRRRRGLVRAVVAERVIALRDVGVWSGPVGHVFGRQVTTSSGEDPRLMVAR
jgi:hypothetical protein